MIGQIADVPGTRRGDSRLDWRIGLSAALDAFEEVLHMRYGSVAEAMFCEDWIQVALDTLAIKAQSAAGQLQCCLRATELQTAVIDG